VNSGSRKKKNTKMLIDENVDEENSEEEDDYESD
jgi:hypothetical protein